MPNQAPQSFSLGMKVAMFIALTVGFILLTAAFLLALGTASSWLPKLLHTAQLSELVYDWGAFLISVLAAVRILNVAQNNLGWPSLGFSRARACTGLLQGAVVATGILLTCFLILLIGGWVQITNINLVPTALLGWFLFFLIQPLAEEVVMRSFLQNQLHRFFGPWIGLFGSALVFGLLHLGNNAFTWIAGLEIMAGGLLMGLLFLHTQNIWGAYAMHAMWNFFQSTVLGFAVSGMDTYRVLQLNVNGPDWLTGGAFGLEGSILSLVLLLFSCWYFWPATANDVPLQEYLEATNDILDEGSST